MFHNNLAFQLNQGLFKFIDEAPPNKQFFVTVSFYEVRSSADSDLRKFRYYNYSVKTEAYNIKLQILFISL